MKPIGPLMWEHRLIEKMARLFTAEIQRNKELRQVNTVFIEAAVDFFRTYADRTHHGKEEEILFRELAKKRLTPEHAKLMDELMQEHVYARKTVGRLAEANVKYIRGDREAVADIMVCLTDLAELYPQHIAKEDKSFFYPCLNYFTLAEQDEMLRKFYEFDRNMIHEKYRTVVEGFDSV
jgi:hemerythrin-like domain-containing protein